MTLVVRDIFSCVSSLDRSVGMGAAVFFLTRSGLVCSPDPFWFASPPGGNSTHPALPLVPFPPHLMPSSASFEPFPPRLRAFVR